jgi:hypothetical protein
MYLNVLLAWVSSTKGESMSWKKVRDFSSMDGFNGFEIRAEGSNHSTYTPSSKCQIIFRIWPEMDSDGNPIPQRDQYGSLTEFAEVKPVVKFLGEGSSKLTFVTEVQGGGESPFDKLSMTIRSAIKNNAQHVLPEWREWISKEKKDKVLDTAKDCLFLQGSLIYYPQGEQKEGQFFLDAQGNVSPKHPVLLLGTPSLQTALLDFCNEEIPGYQDPNDIGTRYTCGHITDPALGYPIVIQYVPQTRQSFSHYKMEKYDKPLPLDVNMLRAEWRPFDRLIKIPTRAEQMEWLKQAFPNTPGPETLDYIFGNTADAQYLPENYRGAWVRYMQGGPGVAPVQQQPLRINTQAQYQPPVNQQQQPQPSWTGGQQPMQQPMQQPQPDSALPSQPAPPQAPAQPGFNIGAPPPSEAPVEMASMMGVATGATPPPDSPAAAHQAMADLEATRQRVASQQSQQ